MTVKTLKSQARVVVIGAGIAGCSTLYHLTREGWTDVVLIERGPRKLLVSITLDCELAPAHGGDPVFAGERQVGSVSSAGYGHRVGKNIAYAYVEPGRAETGTALSIGILGERYPAEVVSPILYDPDNRKPRT